MDTKYLIGAFLGVFLSLAVAGLFYFLLSVQSTAGRFLVSVLVGAGYVVAGVGLPVGLFFLLFQAGYSFSFIIYILSCVFFVFLYWLFVWVPFSSLD